MSFWTSSPYVCEWVHVTEISNRGVHPREARSASPRRALGMAYLYASRVVLAALWVSNALLTVRAVAIHDCENPVSLEMLYERA